MSILDTSELTGEHKKLFHYKQLQIDLLNNTYKLPLSPPSPDAALAVSGFFFALKFLAKSGNLK